PRTYTAAPTRSHTATGTGSDTRSRPRTVGGGANSREWISVLRHIDVRQRNVGRGNDRRLHHQLWILVLNHLNGRRKLFQARLRQFASRRRQGRAVTAATATAHRFLLRSNLGLIRGDVRRNEVRDLLGLLLYRLNGKHRQQQYDTDCLEAEGH